MTGELGGRLTVAACIGCGARSRPGECDDGCSDVPLDIVDAGPVDALAEHVKALEARVDALRYLARAAEAPLDVLRDTAKTALRLTVPPRGEEAHVYQAWGCPRCGRIDAPQPCIGVCMRRPVWTADAAEYRRLARAAEDLADEEHDLAAVARMVANVRSRPGHEEATTAALRRTIAGVLS
jgi:hypothetical protein